MNQSQFDDFWGRAGPGLLYLGIGLYNKRAGQKEAQRWLSAAQGPLYQSAMGAAGGMLGQAADFNPDALAAERFAAGEEMLAGPQAKSLADLQRSLYAKGLLGVGNYNPGIEGVPSEGMLSNPHVAAFYAAQNADRTRRMNQSFDQGQTQANNLVNRASNLQQIAGGAQGTGIAAQDTQPSRSAANAELLRGAMGMLQKNPGIIRDVWDFGSGMLGGVRDFFDPPSFLGGYNAGADFIW